MIEDHDEPDALPGQVSRRETLLGAAVATMGASWANMRANAAQLSARPYSLSGTLKGRAESKGMFFGTALSDKTLADPGYRRNVLVDCDMIVAENALKWQATEPQPDVFRFDEAERLYAFASSNGIRMRGHNLLWYSFVPRWVKAAVPTMTPGQVGDLVQHYIATVVGHWKGRLVQWDVVNEPVNAPDQLTDFVIRQKLGEHYIDLAFHAARAADPDTMLCLNQSAIESGQADYVGRQVGTLALLERLKKRGVPVQALGIESHLRTAIAPLDQRAWARFLAEVSGLDLKFIITEFDIADGGLPGPIDVRDQLAARWAGDYLDTCFANRACLGMLTWSLTDRNSWLHDRPEDARADKAPLRPGLLDDNYQRKPLWGAVAAAFDRAPAR